ncbi:MAG TPA: 30S ribosomal protein S13 [Planctomycetota bacterium]|nr:30S ribosomal protein S13 [Planctomycetota bacterium]
MARIAGVELPNKKVPYALQYIYGIGPKIALEICKKCNIEVNLRANNLTDADLQHISALLDKEYTVEGALRHKVNMDIQRLKKIQSYRGSRHIKNLPVRGQRTRTNARTRKGKKKTVAVKKSVKAM